MEKQNNCAVLLEFVADYFQRVTKLEIVPTINKGDLLASTIPSQQENFEEIKNLIEGKLLKGVTHWQSPFFYAFFSGNISPETVAAEVLSQCLNYSIDQDDQHLRDQLESEFCDFLGSDLFSLPESFLNRGGGLSLVYNAAAEVFVQVIHAAKNKKRIEQPDPQKRRALAGKMVGYMTHQCNFTVVKAIECGNLTLRRVMPSSQSAIDLYTHTEEQLRTMFEEDIKQGLLPTVFFVTIGTSCTLAIDDVKTIGTVCREFGVWLHIDAAFLGAYAMLPEFKPGRPNALFKDVELGDSVNLNGHKSFGMGVSASFFWTSYSKQEFARFMCYGTDDQARLEKRIESHGIRFNFWEFLCGGPCSGCGITQEERDSARVRTSDLYLFGNIGSRFIRSFLFLKAVGISKIQEALRMDIVKAQRLREFIAKDERFEILNREGMPLICFKLRSRGTEYQEKLCDELNKTKKIYLGVAADRGEVFIRLMFGIFTQADVHIVATWQLIKDTTDKLFKK